MSLSCTIVCLLHFSIKNLFFTKSCFFLITSKQLSTVELKFKFTSELETLKLFSIEHFLKPYYQPHAKNLHKYIFERKNHIYWEPYYLTLNYR